jgi:signal peptidase II
MQSAFRSPGSILRFVLTAVVLTGLDLWTKQLAFSKLMEHGEPYPFIPGWLEFEVVRNYGAVFGFGQGARTVFIVVSIGAIIFLCYLFAASGKRWVYQLLLGMLMAGVLGNLYDRVEFGFVRDMIHALPRWKNFFPYVFNVADSCLCTGVTLMLIYSLVNEYRGKKNLAKDEAEKIDG